MTFQSSYASATPMLNKKLITGGIALVVAGVLLGMQLQRILDDDTRAALQKLVEAFQLIDERYVEDVDAGELAESALRGMLEDLDPHSAYIDAASMNRVEEDFQGSFEGIGISFEFVEGLEGQDSLAVVSVIPGGPSEDVGLMSGDRIITVDGQSTVGFTSLDVQRNLKGPSGTKVSIEVVRPGYQGVIPFTITRGKIPLYSVDSAYMVDEVTGYIKVSRFARTTYREFRQALTDLEDQGMERLMLDLRSNAGGYMDIAVQMADEFLPDDAVIVSQRGRMEDSRRQFSASARGRLEQGPVIVLVDESSASASEIVAGALQDNDRGLIVGRQTFGKGLVQQQYPLPDGSALRVTVSHFYTPSGRLIQTPYLDGNREDYLRAKAEMHEELALLSSEEIVARVPDSLLYTTTGGRTVIGGGGILPDFIVQPDSASPLLQAVFRRNLTNTFARYWYDRHNQELREVYGEDKQRYIADFQVDDVMMETFLAYAAERGVHIAGAQVAQEGFSEEELAEDVSFLKARIKARLGVRLFELDTFYPIMHPEDRTFTVAMTLWPEATALTPQGN